ncbi:acyl-CoA thioesterase [Halorubrum sp. CBA1125]|uniref:acyl-CoA thioesterase n=1 Tax=Halorubrum sp. CBA1125 TaxID=2668072 RepID=UPI0012E8C539|nr:thioesterase family protein [Halorubrum sp. CBA1125]MUW13827.1 acyl-CoA thioesterase [Halorubrum sp. CBA1125]
MVYATEIPVRFRDVDALGHVNNAVYATYLEQARVEYIRDVLGADVTTEPTVLASLTIDYRRPVELADDAVTVTVAVDDVGRSSLTMSHEIRVDDGVAAEAEGTLVALDPESGEPREIPREQRSAIREYRDR